MVSCYKQFRGLFFWKARTCLKFTLLFPIADLDIENPDQADEIEMKDNPVYGSHRSGQQNHLPARNKQASRLV